jgi:hypothetical protein
MGVQIFMLIGFKNENREMLQSKSVPLSILFLDQRQSDYFTRLETPKSHPTLPAFTPIFNQSGKDVWNEWDKFLDQQTSLSFTSLPNNTTPDSVLVPPAEGEYIKAGPSDKSVPWPLDHDINGLPILPSNEGRSLPDVKHIIRSFLSLTYRKSIPPRTLVHHHSIKFRTCSQQCQGICPMGTYCSGPRQVL